MWSDGGVRKTEHPTPFPSVAPLKCASNNPIFDTFSSNIRPERKECPSNNWCFHHKGQQWRLTMWRICRAVSLWTPLSKLHYFYQVKSGEFNSWNCNVSRCVKSLCQVIVSSGFARRELYGHVSQGQNADSQQRGLWMSVALPRIIGALGQVDTDTNGSTSGENESFGNGSSLETWLRKPWRNWSGNSMCLWQCRWQIFLRGANHTDHHHLPQIDYWFIFLQLELVQMLGSEWFCIPVRMCSQQLPTVFQVAFFLVRFLGRDVSPSHLPIEDAGIAVSLVCYPDEDIAFRSCSLKQRNMRWTPGSERHILHNFLYNFQVTFHILPLKRYPFSSFFHYLFALLILGRCMVGLFVLLVVFSSCAKESWDMLDWPFKGQAGVVPCCSISVAALELCEAMLHSMCFCWSWALYGIDAFCAFPCQKHLLVLAVRNWKERQIRRSTSDFVAFGCSLTWD